MTVYDRSIETDIEARLFETGKIIVLYGPRQVGKTTLAKRILARHDSMAGYFNCEEQPVADILATNNSITMQAYFSGTKVVVLDEAQTVENIGRALKILIDAYPEMNIIASGSSSFDLANKLSEPLTGRYYEYFLHPLSFYEIALAEGNRAIFEQLDQRLVYGGYPEVVTASSLSDARTKLESLATSYLYRDVFKFANIKRPKVLTDILRALAFQVGNEVSHTELANLVGADKKTVTSYINLLEQAFIVFPLGSFSRNLRNEIKNGMKYYFYDNGIISALTGDFRLPVSGRDMGALWENLMVSERLKFNQRNGLYKALYFWRLGGIGEIDLVESYDSELHPYEFKYRKSKASSAQSRFVKAYDSKPVEIINSTNFFEFTNG
jgi:predicted AAA+ superfamily ATPase